MPKLNLKDEDGDETRPLDDDFSSSAPPTLRDFGGGSSGGGPSPILQILIAVVVLGAGTFALNYFGVIHLWGKKPMPRVIQPAPQEMAQEPPVQQAPAEQTPTPVEQTPTPTPSTAQKTPTPAASKAATQQAPPRQMVKPAPAVQQPMGSGAYTIQVSAWQSRSKADEEVSKLSQAGFPAYVEASAIGGDTWYRVRVGRYQTRNEAGEQRDKFQRMLAGNIWVARASAN
jgi:cell division septation protein DedD